jgi:hypothetical protein
MTSELKGLRGRWGNQHSFPDLDMETALAQRDLVQFVRLMHSDTAEI